ncbi:YsnF/AvaK domain-containing protein [Metabacillus fastidiosus]|uniref:YsnF/AvaK domain-containing protein n=1 Tax=Metabacillus fastidiosus TaxID=1458 RepID=UPI003D2CEA9F
MSKEILGIYNSSDDLIHAIEGFQHKGYSMNDLSIIANTRDFPSAIQDETGVTSEELGGTDDVQSYERRGFVEGLAFPFTIDTHADQNTTSYSNYLVGLGFDETAAREYEEDINSGKILLLADKGIRNMTHNSVNTTGSNIDIDRTNNEEHSIKLHEEQLDVSKDRVQTGEVEVTKDVVEEQKTVHVPVTHEEVYVERRAVNNDTTDTNASIGDDETIRVPIVEEKVEVTKRPAVTEELVIGKRKVTETEQVTENIKREKARVETDGDAMVEETDIDTPLDNDRL